MERDLFPVEGHVRGADVPVARLADGTDIDEGSRLADWPLAAAILRREIITIHGEDSGRVGVSREANLIDSTEDRFHLFPVADVASKDVFSCRLSRGAMDERDSPFRVVPELHLAQEVPAFVLLLLGHPFLKKLSPRPVDGGSRLGVESHRSDQDRLLVIPEEVGLEIIAEIDAFNGLRQPAGDRVAGGACGG